MSDEATAPAIHPSGLIGWIKANFYATVLLTVAVCGALIGAGKYLANSEYQITQNQAEIKTAGVAIARHQLDLESIDRRINELSSHTAELFNQAMGADAAIRARIDVLDERSKYAVERATQPNIPQPYQPGPGARR